MLNNVCLNGRITRNLELKQTSNNNSSLNITLAVERNFKDQNGQKQTDFISCKVFGKRAETIAQYCQKGDLISITGSIQTGSYQKQDGTKIYTTDVMVNEFSFIAKSQQANQNNQANQFNQHLNNFNQQNNLGQNNAFNSFDNQNKVNALDYINQANSVQNNGNTGQFNQQQQMQINGTGGINNTNNLYTDFSNNSNFDDFLESVANPFTQE
ncbi:MAG: single-stranded DNA-binding protein [Finegoldia magna]|jgi:single-strand binding protein|nr:single-stranded DNA-binding protein [Finegoldia magna]DAP17641.1 MAG TPA: Single strand binding protein [Caudoviricetes sp.]